MQHGLLCRDVVLPGEDAEAFEDLRNRVWADLVPAGPLEELCYRSSGQRDVEASAFRAS